MTDHFNEGDGLLSLLLTPVVRRPVPSMFAAFAIGAAVALVLRRRGVLEAIAEAEGDEDHDQGGWGGDRLWGLAQAAWDELPDAPGSGEHTFADAHGALAGLKAAALDAAAGYLTRAVDEIADRAEQTIRR